MMEFPSVNRAIEFKETPVPLPSSHIVLIATSAMRRADVMLYRAHPVIATEDAVNPAGWHTAGRARIPAPMAVPATSDAELKTLPGWCLRSSSRLLKRRVDEGDSFRHVIRSMHLCFVLALALMGVLRNR